MERYDLTKITSALYSSEIKLFSTKLLRDFVVPKAEASFFKVLARLVKSGVVTKIERDKYFLKSKAVSNFTVANFLYPQSYVSFESALNYYGILSQFPKVTTCATVNKTGHKTNEFGSFTYTHIQKGLFWGFVKTNDYLIAQPEKALLDEVYFKVKGLKEINLAELDISRIDTKILAEYLNYFKNTGEYSRVKKMAGLLKI